ncbi:glycosyltransferase involved in cell wall biosynthesis [Novosphingobium kunmingense]|uniref:Glycosyltransferase involved in cell wall biosynthesis n=1 Tax=Novosphingobium kunmingense TaxID=1211806 RepID=A0A2N0I441_9SPHN|nr:glycosyltransferase [Novosphingobium kunmingense]PKB25954.1 glycosyltransferase involved in cell wall biosynthesis [Novosphingobium kunmingense]
MSARAGRLKLLHLHSSFAAGGKELRAAKLMNAFGRGIDHTVVSAEPGAHGAAAAVDTGISVSYPDDFPALQGRPFPRRLQKLARAMLGHDLVLTYNWGAMDAVLAHTLFAEALDLPPLVHHEDGFNEDEAQRLKPARNWFRRIALHRAQGLVVPSQRLEAIALRDWRQPRRMVHRVPNGVPVFAYGGKVRPDALPRLTKRPGELWLGTLAGLRPVKNLPRLVRAFAGLPEPWQLVILGDGPERAAIRAEAERLGVMHRVHLPGFVPDPAKAVGLFDVFALSSDSEQFPISVVEAMAAGLAVAAPDVGDVAAMLSAENAPYIAPPGDEAALAHAIARLAADPAARAAVGTANRARAEAEYDEAAMVAAYARIYAGALGRTQFP